MEQQPSAGARVGLGLCISSPFYSCMGKEELVLFCFVSDLFSSSVRAKRRHSHF